MRVHEGKFENRLEYLFKMTGKRMFRLIELLSITTGGMISVTFRTRKSSCLTVNIVYKKIGDFQIPTAVRTF